MAYNKHISQPLVYPDFLQRSPDLGAGQVPNVQPQPRKHHSFKYEKENMINREDFSSVQRSMDRPHHYMGKHQFSVIPEEKENPDQSMSQASPRSKFELQKKASYLPTESTHDSSA